MQFFYKYKLLYFIIFVLLLIMVGVLLINIIFPSFFEDINSKRIPLIPIEKSKQKV